jgi:hypothetical protein
MRRGKGAGGLKAKAAKEDFQVVPVERSSEYNPRPYFKMGDIRSSAQDHLSRHQTQEAARFRNVLLNRIDNSAWDI